MNWLILLYLVSMFTTYMILRKHEDTDKNLIYIFSILPIVNTVIPMVTAMLYVDNLM